MVFISEKEREYHRRESRRLAIMDERDRQDYQFELEERLQALQLELEKMRIEQERIEAERTEREEIEQIRAEKKRLLDLCKQHGIDPGQPV